MCNAASFWQNKEGKVFWDDPESGPSVGESHDAIAKKHKLYVDGVRGANLVKYEITPPNNDYTLSLDQWVYRLDQDELPDWYDAAKVEALAREKLVCWRASKIVLPGESRVVENGHVIVYGSAVLRGSSRAVLRDYSSAELWGSSRAELWDYSSAVLWGSSSAANIALNSPTAVLIDRSVSGKVTCHVGGKDAEKAKI